MTTSPMHTQSGVGTDATSEQARRAVKAFRSMQPGLSAFARVLTRDRKVSVQLASGGPRTDGKKIYYRPPIALGAGLRHDRTLCDKRDAETQAQKCPACAVREEVMIQIYHEISHIAFGSFATPEESDKAELLSHALKEYPGRFAAQVRERIEKTPAIYLDSYLNLAGIVSPFLPQLLNALEDVRIDNAMFRARKGTKVMFDAMTTGIFRAGIETDVPGERVMWNEQPLNAQIIVGVFCLGSEYNYEGWFSPSVELALADQQLRTRVIDAITSPSAGEVYRRSFSILSRLRELGFLKNEFEEDDDDSDSDDSSDDSSSDAGDSEDDMDNDQQGAGQNDQQDAEEDVDDESDASSSSGAGGSGDSDPDDSDDSSSEDSADAGSESGNGELPDEEADEGPGEDSQVPDSPDSSDSADGEASQKADDQGPDSDESEDAQDAGKSSGGSDVSSDDADGQDGPPSGGESSVSQGEPEAPHDTREPESGAGGNSETSESDHGDSDEGMDRGEVDAEDGSSGGADSRSQDDPQGSAGDGGSSADTSLSDQQRGESSPEREDSVHDGEDSEGQHESEDRSQDASEPDGSDAGSDSSDEGSPQDVVDTGADEGKGGVIVPGEAEPDYGTPDDLTGTVEVFAHHGEIHVEEAERGEDGSGKSAHASTPEERAVDIAIIQGLYFEQPSGEVGDVKIWRYGDSADDDPYFAWQFADAYTNFEDLSETQCEMIRIRGARQELEVPESVMGPATLHARRTFNENMRADREKNMRSGKIRGAAIAKRAPFGDDRLFGKKSIPGKKSYSVVIGVDISGSTMGENLILAKKAAFAQAELCRRVGIDFAVYAHTTGHSYSWMDENPGYAYRMDMYEIKSFDDEWTGRAKESLAQLKDAAGNLDGHSVEFYRKIVERRPTTDKIVMYYTDGKMPAANHDEELEVLQREIKYCNRTGITLMGVGIRTDSPIRHGLDTVQIDTEEDLGAVVKHLGKRIELAR